MKYVGPEAARMGTSFEEATAAISIMSDAGVKGTQAGTSLRTMLQRLAAPTGKASDLMAELGLEVYDAEGQMKPLGELLPHLSNSLSGMSEESRNAALNTIFGKESMSGVSALLKEADAGFQELTDSLIDSDGAAKDFADTINSGLSGTIEEMMGALETAGIELTEALAPAITEVAETVTELVGSFNELDDETQQQIINYIAMAAAMGPALSLIGRMGQGIGTLTTLGGGVVRMFGRLKGSSELAGTALVGTSKGITATGTAAATAGGAKGVGSLVTAVGTGLPWALGIAAVAFGGWTVWDQWGRDAYNASQETEKWGTSVGTEADGVLTTMQTLQSETSGQIGLMAQGVEGNTEQMAEDFRVMGETIETSLTGRIEKLDEIIAGLPETVNGTLGEILQQDKTNLENSLDEISSYHDRIAEINQNASDNNRELTITEANRIQELTQESAEAYVQTLGLTKDEQETILVALTGDIESATKDQAHAWAQSLGEQRKTLTDDLADKRDLLEEDLRATGNYSDERIEELLDTYDRENQIVTDGIDQQLATIAEKYPEIAEEIGFTNGKIIAGSGLMQQKMVEDNEKIIQNANVMTEELARNAEVNAEQMNWLADESTEAGEAWNNLVFDPKTGEVKTNVRDVIIEASKSDEQWENMEWALQYADLDSNAKVIIGEAAVVNGRWDTMEWADKSAVLDNDFSRTIYQALEDSGKWEAMTLEEKSAVVYSNTPEKMTETLLYLGLWDEYEPEIKEINAENYEFMNVIRQSEEKMNEWQALEPETKTLLGDNYDLMTAIFESEVRFGLFKQIPDEEKQMLAENTDLLNKITMSEQALSHWNELPEADKHLLVDNESAMMAIIDSETSFKRWNDLPEDDKKILADNTDLLNTLLTSQFEYDSWQILPDSQKLLMAHTNAPETTEKLQTAKEASDALDGERSVVYTDTDSQLVTEKLGVATNAAQTLDRQNPHVPTGTDSPLVTDKLSTATGAAQTLNSQSPYVPTSTNANSTSGQLSGATGSAQTLAGQRPYIGTSTNARATENAIRDAGNTASAWDGFTSWINVGINRLGDWTGLWRTGTQSLPKTGFSILGDGGRREPYLTPQGHFGVSGNTDELHHLPKGTRIWPSRQSFKTSARSSDYLKQYLGQIPKFAQGGTIENPYDGYTGLVGEAGPEIFQIAQGKVSITPISQNQRTQVLDSQKTTDMTETNQLLQSLIQLVAQGQVIQMDGTEVGRTIYDEVDTIMNNNFERRSFMNMRGGA